MSLSQTRADIAGSCPYVDLCRKPGTRVKQDAAVGGAHRRPAPDGHSQESHAAASD
jgi:hypothetical protein